MPADYLDSVLAADTYTDALTIGPSFQAEKAVIVVENNDCYMQFATGKPGAWYWHDEREFKSIQQSLTVARIIGVRFRNAVAGQPSKITANLIEPTDPDFVSGVPLTPGTQVTVAGWIDLSDRGTFTFVSADATVATYVIAAPQDLTQVVPIGARFSLVQNGVTSYFVVTAVTNTQITLYGGVNFVVTNNPITQPNYSTGKVPLGFPINPANWTQTLVDANDRIQINPSASTWYNPGAVSITFPVGVWRISAKGYAQVNLSAATDAEMFSTLSTVNNGATDNDLVAISRLQDTDATNGKVLGSPVLVSEKVLALAAKTTYFLNILVAGTGVSSIAFLGASGTPTILRAECAYL